MALESWWQVTTPHSDIVKGKLDEAIFAADLGDVVSGKAPQEYRDTDLFFRKTYLTAGLSNLLEEVIGRLSSGGGSGVIQLQTPFGGGKTHALLALYHAVQNRDKATHISYLESLIGALPKETKVASFVGTHADPLKGKTPWGVIANQLGAYNIVKEHDKKRVAPGKERLSEVFDISGPALILVDEILEYIVKSGRAEEAEKTEKGQTLAFLQELTEVVSTKPNLVLVLTLPASLLEQYDEEAEKALAQLQKISGRVEAIFTPVEGMEIYEVIRTRLFEDIGDEIKRKDAASAYLELYQKLGNDVPAEVREVAYREKIERAYPFHPEFIDILYERWGSFPTFQRTRGVLRLLAQVVENLYKKKDVAALIHSSLVNLNEIKVRREFVKHIGNEFDSVIAADIAGIDGKAPKIDESMGSEYEKYGIARGIATSVFLYSFSGGDRKGITLPALRVALLREGIPPMIVGDAVKKLEEELWYFHAEGNLFSFTNQPNLNRVILDREETIIDGDIEEELKDELQRIVGSDFGVKLWPRETSDVPDGRRIKLAVLSPGYPYPDNNTKGFVQDLYQRAGSAYRTNKNTLLVLTLDAQQWPSLKSALKRYLALKALDEDARLKETLSPPSRTELEKKYKEAEERVPSSVLTAYRHLARSSPEGSTWTDLGMPTLGAAVTVSSRIKDFLIDREILLTGISAKALLDKTFSAEEDEKLFENIFDIFLKTPGMPLIDSEESLSSSIRDAVAAGQLGLKRGEDIYYKESLARASEGDYVLRPAKAKILKDIPVVVEPPEEGYKGGGAGVVITGGKKPEEGTAGTVSNIHVKAVVSWDQLSNIIGGVVRPLRDRGGELEITIDISAHSNQGFDRTTLDSKVKETLQQIGAKIIRWEEH